MSLLNFLVDVVSSLASGGGSQHQPTQAERIAHGRAQRNLTHPNIFNDTTQRYEPIYNYVGQKRGFFKDDASPSGWSYSNAHGHISYSPHAPGTNGYKSYLRAGNLDGSWTPFLGGVNDGSAYSSGPITVPGIDSNPSYNGGPGNGPGLSKEDYDKQINYWRNAGANNPQRYFTDKYGHQIDRANLPYGTTGY